MLETNIEKFIICACSEEVRRYKESFYQPDELEHDKNQWTYIVELMIITIKSLIPDEVHHGSVIDYKRFNEELKLWYHYRHGDNISLLGSLYNDEKTYWDYEDDSIFSRITPIVFVNEDWIVAKKEVLKNILYSSGNIYSIFEGLALSKLFFLLINNISINYDELINQIKEEMICFSQKDFIRMHSKDFKFSLDTYKGNFVIDFERKRIEILNILNGVNLSSKYSILKQSLNVLREQGESGLPTFFLGGLKGLKSVCNYTPIKDEEFIKSLCGFLVKLRKGRFSVESLKIDKYLLPDVFQYKEGDVFFHTLLKKCQVVKIINEPKRITSFIRTKTGIYRFRRYKG
ncbi:hypothetical protein DW1_1060 [Proteiniborus sp. DW1]|uniref:hypothetical protein n=1 Tax=Proteiniborus sp. DW1 TaxID=1889883 RepID=UPI00092E1D35|nr:hypothetical protein [Proteiniborus sp. DW1]SCG82656.1 hypothetical protein DW1_1060 [Proteiniborus sp. DW1]